MPLETIGNLALAGSSGASARGARSISNDSSNAAFAASQARGGDTGGNVIQIPSPAPHLAAYLSPFIRFDPQTRLAIVEFRDSQSGEVEQQYPSPRAVRQYQQNLPEDSDLRVRDHSEAEEELPVAHTVGQHLSGQKDDTTEAAPPSFGSGAPAAPAIAPVAPSVASAATAAFTSLQNTLTGGRQLAVA